MMGGMANAMRLQAQRVMAGMASARVGIVRNFDPNIWAVRVELQPDGIPSGWLPLASPWIGNGWGMFCAPGIGDMVSVSFFGSDLEAGFVEARLFNDEDRPLPVQSGELWVVHASGAFFKLQNDGSATFSDGHGASVRLNGDGTITSVANAWNHTGPVNVDGAVTVTQTLTATVDVIGGGKSLKTHRHGGVLTGGGVTGAPV